MSDRIKNFVAYPNKNRGGSGHAVIYGGNDTVYQGGKKSASSGRSHSYHKKSHGGAATIRRYTTDN